MTKKVLGQPVCSRKPWSLFVLAWACSTAEFHKSSVPTLACLEIGYPPEDSNQKLNYLLCAAFWDFAYWCWPTAQAVNSSHSHQQIYHWIWGEQRRHHSLSPANLCLMFSWLSCLLILHDFIVCLISIIHLSLSHPPNSNTTTTTTAATTSTTTTSR